MGLIPSAIIPDASVLFSFFKLDSIRRNIFRELLKKECKFISPEFVLEELLSDKEKIMKYAGINEFEFSYLFQLINKEINKILEKDYKKFLLETNEISPHEKDHSYFALALSKNLPIWSDEKAFKKQSKIKVYSTDELLSLLKLSENANPENSN